QDGRVTARRKPLSGSSPRLSVWRTWVIYQGRVNSTLTREDTMTEKKDGTAAQKAPDGITRKDAVRQALTTLGKDATRAQIQKFVKDQHGFEMTLDYITNCKGEIRKEKGRSKSAVTKQPPATKAVSSPPAPSAPSRQAPGISLEDIETVKDLVD